MLKELINKILWHPGYSPEDYEVVYLHREGSSGKCNNLKKRISMDSICIKGSFIVFERDCEVTTIPLHRVLEIRNKKTGEILYRKSRR
ncbi:MAG TPA: DUF504 domain-containing protein [Methanothermococcus okinawensis]|uniref:UPF0248 protein MHHB_P0519 n=1 Tax=Methanofervidicoccus abyssi TaxID=2082189 RepID=A0A401HPY1_9EURY|nr:DUF504 domain-containing protein [Methanofervidicoccus abyssi]GBF36289.1 conserved hypothetical protein [Methanofervidicoccus abyssi]HIP16005.1 DUF504 domain-containing protein [Methanothermococcus okinawensis]HIP35174.1 DUF504 domain-containing protein [Methanothermococcus okinawensis]